MKVVDHYPTSAWYWMDKEGMSPWWPFWYHTLNQHCNSPEDWPPKDFTKGWPIFKRVAEYLSEYQNTWWHHQMDSFRITGPLWGEFTSHRWIPFKKASDMELLCFFLSVPEQTVEQTIGDLRHHRAHYGVTVMVAPGMVARQNPHWLKSFISL